ncbi:hypothetical protein GGX14DRAFT_397109 [Mycena pura]|uniref:ARM repeat-containing protein n=1 Tax=Mycena pura TaxID=153505 RepID=A0AAD6VD38_9AGAR|nr:hypothetical protein GGX14DRAFT_397109 [Mycena pura]
MGLFCKLFATTSSALRIRLLLAAAVDDHDEQWNRTKYNLIEMAEMGFVPDVRRILVRAALAGLKAVSSCASQDAKYSVAASREMLAVFDQTAKLKCTVALEMIQVLKYSDDEVSDVIIAGIATLAQISEFRPSILASIPEITDLLKDNNDTAGRVGAANSLKELSKQRKISIQSQNISLTNAFQLTSGNLSRPPGVPRITNLLKDNNDSVSEAGVNALTTFAEHDLFKADYWFVRESGANLPASKTFGGSLAAECRGFILASMSQITDLLEHNRNVNWSQCARTLGKLSKQGKISVSSLVMW